MTKNESDRRRHPRFTVVEGMVETITIALEPDKKSCASDQAGGGPKDQPAILTDLSAGGMSLILFLEPPKSRRLEMVLNLPGLDKVPVEGRIVRLSEKGHTYNIGIQFTKIANKHRDRIDSMAQDNQDCDSRLSLRLPEACVPNCTFHALCSKTQKGPYWKKS